MARSIRIVLAASEILILAVLILGTRCANYHDVFVEGNIYFTDADCYARMARVRICAEHPGTILRHHDFENFPQGTTPHTTAPLDYLIVGLSILLKPFTPQPIDLAGAVISPFLGLIAGLFLWWWSRRMRFGYRWLGLILYAISPILVHGTELGRPDHQSLLILVVAIGVCSEWVLRFEKSRNFSIVSAAAWGLALWISLYEPLILLALILLIGLVQDRHLIFAPQRRLGWIVFAGIIILALLVERRIPTFPIGDSRTLLQNWSRSIGELAHVSPLDRVWFVWAGYLIALAPILILLGWSKSMSIRETRTPTFVIGLLIATFSLTIWQARWSYFFVSIFVIALPTLLTSIKSRVAVWVGFVLSTLPILQSWDTRLWPSEEAMAARIERRTESKQLRQLALTIRSPQMHPFLAPWWLSPPISYWSGQPGIAGSSHEALEGTADSARFFLTEDLQRAREMLQDRRVDWVFVYDWDRVGQNSASLFGSGIAEGSMGRILDRASGQGPRYLVLSGQNGSVKLFRFASKL